MTRTHVASTALFFAASLLAHASAQTVAEPLPPPGPDLSIGIVPIHENDDGQLWAATDRYKVSFDGHATFVPYLGSDYPENRPFAWHTTSVRVGESELLAADEAPARWHAPLRYEYRYGAVTEAYDVLAEGLEQTFTIHRRPAGRGDLVVTGRVATELCCPATAGDACALTFADANGHAITSYGAATVIDAGGRRGPVRTAFCDGELTLTVAASWLDDARFPLVVDPLLTRVSLANGQMFSSVDVAFSDDTDRTLVAYAAAASSLDRDLYAKMANSDWSGASTVFSDLSTADTPHVRVAASGHPTNPRFAIVFQSRTWTLVGGTQVRRWNSHVRLRILTANTGTTGFTVVMTRPSGSHDWRPDVGGNSADILGGGEPAFVVVFQREASGTWFGNTATSGLEVLLMAGSIQLAARSLSPITFGGNDMERPSISKSSLSGMVAWQERQSTNSSDDWNVVGKYLTVMPSGLSVSSGSWISSGGVIRSHHRMGPQVGGRQECVVAFSRSPLAAVPSAPSEIEGHSLCTERVDWPSSTPVNYPERTIEGPFSTAQIVVGDCRVSGFAQYRFWAVTRHSSRAGGGDGSVSIVRVGYTGRPTENAVLFSATSAEQGEAGGLAFDQSRNRWPIVWATSASAFHSVEGNMFTFTPAAPTTLGGVSCGTASLVWWGNQQIGSDGERARLTGAQPSVAALLVLALSTANIDLTPFQMPFCRALVALGGPTHVAIVATTTNPGGEVEFWLPLPEHLSSMTLHLQWFYQQPNANPLGLVSTQRLTVPLAR